MPIDWPWAAHVLDFFKENWHWCLLGFYSIEWIIRIVMTFVVTRKRKPVSAMAWLLILYFVPVVGLIAYILIGRPRLPRRRIQEHRRLLDKLSAVDKGFQDRAHTERPDLGPASRGAVVLAERLGHMPILGGNHVEILTEDADFIDRLVAEIDGAERQVHMLYYIWAPDEIGLRVLDAVGRAADRGVKCRLLADAVGSKKLFGKRTRQLRKRGVEIYEALPAGILRSWAERMDLRNHRKLTVVDGRAAFTGSHNIVDPSYGHKDLVWRDMSVRVTGPVVLELQTLFLSDWRFETGELHLEDECFPEPTRTGEIPVQTLPSGPNYPTENYQRLVVDAIHAAEKRVTITTPYFVPDEAFMQAMQTAVLRGVPVDLIAPRRCDQIIVGAAARSYFAELLDIGVRVHLFEDGLLHAKTVNIDDSLAFIGSSNFDIRSFALNFEINLLFYSRDTANRLREKHEEYLTRCTTLTRAEWAGRSRVRAAFQNIARLMSPLL